MVKEFILPGTLGGQVHCFSAVLCPLRKVFTTSLQTHSTCISNWQGLPALNQEKNLRNFPSRRYRFVARILCFEIMPCLSLTHYSNRERASLFFESWVGTFNPGPPLATPPCISNSIFVQPDVQLLGIID